MLGKEAELLAEVSGPLPFPYACAEAYGHSKESEEKKAKEKRSRKKRLNNASLRECLAIKQPWFRI